MTSHDNHPEVETLLRQAGPRTTIEPEQFEALDHAVRAAWQKQVTNVATSPEPPSRTWLVALAATVLAAVALAIGWISTVGRGGDVALGEVVRILEAGATLDSRPARSGDRLFPGALVEAEGAVALSLVGGQSVRLRSGSVLRLQDTESFELESGAVYIDSPAGGAITVLTPFGRATEVGTRFEVSVEPGGMLVRIRDGAVEVRSVEGAEPKTVGSAGESVRLDASGTVERGSVAGDAAEWQWAARAAPDFLADSPSARQLLDWYARELGLEVVYANDAVMQSAEETFNGLGGGVSIDLVPALLEGVGLQAFVDGGRLVVEDREAP